MSSGAVVLGGSTSGSTTITAPAVAGTNTITTPAETGVMTTSISPYISSFRNRLINGEMKIDQPLAGATTVTSGPSIDMWYYNANVASKFTIQQNFGGTGAPPGFSHYLGAQSASSYTPSAGEYFMQQTSIEANNVSDFLFGTANAVTTTLSFWVYATTTGTHSGHIANYVGTRCYIFTFSVPIANTWTYCTVQIPGDTSGTWVMAGNGGAISIRFCLGAGSTYRGTAGSWGSTFYAGVTGGASVVGTAAGVFNITGVQLEKGAIVTPFEFRDYATELARCQRYFYSTFPTGTAPAQNLGLNGALIGMSVNATVVPGVSWRFPTMMCVAPTITTFNPLGYSTNWINSTNTTADTPAIGTSTSAGVVIAGSTATNTELKYIHATADARI